LFLFILFSTLWTVFFIPFLFYFEFKPNRASRKQRLQSDRMDTISF
jgi:hypothetical protein